MLDTIKLGKIIYVQNTRRKSIENQQYIAIQVEDQNGDNQRCILFTEIEISDMQKIHADWLLEFLKAGRIYKITINHHPTNLLKVITAYNEEKILRISNTQLKHAQHRAVKNPQDLTKKSLLTDLFD